MMSEKDNNQIDISVVIPVYNSADLIKANLPSILNAINIKKNIEVIVVDDYSSDGSYKILKNGFKSVKVIRHSIRRGFSSSVNTGARSSKGRLMVIINICIVPSKNFLNKVLKRFKDGKVFAVSLHVDAESWQSAVYRSGFVQFKNSKNLSRTHETSWVNSDNTVYRRDYWMKLGGMDEQIFKSSLWQDIDLSYRALKRGFIILWEPDSHATSTFSGTTDSCVSQMYKRDQLLFMWKNITSAAMFRKHVLGLVRRIASEPKYIIIIASAIKKFRHIFRSRQREKKECKFSDEAIFAKFQDNV